MSTFLKCANEASDRDCVLSDQSQLERRDRVARQELRSFLALNGCQGAAADRGRHSRGPKKAVGLIAGIAAALFTGCAVGPNYSRPSVPAQTSWKEGTVATNATKLPTDWWKIFNDEQLSSLETTAIQANQDLQLAVARVTEARPWFV
jgi:hypothetical protein